MHCAHECLQHNHSYTCAFMTQHNANKSYGPIFGFAVAQKYEKKKENKKKTRKLCPTLRMYCMNEYRQRVNVGVFARYNNHVNLNYSGLRTCEKIYSFFLLLHSTVGDDDDSDGGASTKIVCSILFYFLLCRR